MALKGGDNVGKGSWGQSPRRKNRRSSRKTNSVFLARPQEPFVSEKIRVREEKKRTLQGDVCPPGVQLPRIRS